MSNYKTAMGKTVNMEQLRAKNQGTRAVGNMNVDAAGNTLDSHNRVISDSSRRVNEVYNRSRQNPGAIPRQVSANRPQQRASQPAVRELDLSSNELQQMNDWDAEEPVGKSVR
jgi:hypothetical protein